MNDVLQECLCVKNSLNVPLCPLENELLRQQVAIERWFREQWQGVTQPFYCSADLRNAGFKLAPVDTNLFPAGFNNLNPASLPLMVSAAQAALEQICPDAKRILIVPENHTRNLFYLENVAALQSLFFKAGFETRIGSLLPELKTPRQVPLPSGHSVLLEPLERTGNRVGVGHFAPCLVLLNNDLAEGVPEILQGLEQVILPSLRMGWDSRLKSLHFEHYRTVAEDFARQFSIDRWQIDPLFRKCGEVDFMKQEGLNCLEYNARLLLRSIKRKYDEYAIDREPFVVVKADAGTYGMAVMMIKDPGELRRLNRKQRTRMSAIKGGQAVTKIILQEGVYTTETVGEDRSVAEPVVYMMGRHVIGGFYRVHAGRGVDENLNAPGMHFHPLAFNEACNNPTTDSVNCYANRFYVYGVIARLAALAAGRELEGLK